MTGQRLWAGVACLGGWPETSRELEVLSLHLWGLFPQLDSIHSLQEAPAQQPLGMLSVVSALYGSGPATLGMSPHFSCLRFSICQRA